ncbi:MAG: MBL fold metallo-hydrolase, partial [bacterium]
MTTTLEWLGTATFRLTIGDLVLFLDAYMDRVPAAPPVGLSTAAVTRADFVLVGHSHFDHLAGAEVIAANTGAKIIGSNESCRVMRERGVPDAQLLPSQGGERHRLADGVTVRVFPSLHACTWILTDTGSGEEDHRHEGLTQDDLAAVPGGLVQRITELALGGTEDGRVIMEHI